MKIRPGAVALGVIGLGIGGLGVGALREATLSTHQRVPPRSLIAVVISAEDRGSETNQSLAEMVEAQVAFCRLEVASDLVEPVRDLGEHRFRAVLQPSMDQTNRRQFRGCLEDWTLDHLRMDVIAIDDVDDPADLDARAR